ncbi:hypothetical protein [Legionella sp. km772]|uniref:hypothetical protein n=1 Tax=Legionella sp. km772 TaxID=2498111 RepID=UPI000F8F23FE|nr:hypothetical protein [Legionella sp. km772]RUR08291.1 hypothetical protein ELY15_11305 [Legionella sp. km772]
MKRFVVVLSGFSMLGSVYATNCVGTATSACSNMTSESSCQNAYLSGTSNIQCQWSGGSCIDGGGACVSSTTVMCKGNAVSSCNNLSSSTCNNSYISGAENFQCEFYDNGQCGHTSTHCEP